MIRLDQGCDFESNLVKKSYQVVWNGLKKNQFKSNKIWFYDKNHECNQRLKSPWFKSITLNKMVETRNAEIILQYNQMIIID